MATSHDPGLMEEAASTGVKLRDRFDDRNGIVRTTRMIGGAMVTLLLVAVVLNQVFGAVDVGSGPFAEIGDQLQNTGVAAVGLLIVGLLVVAANRIMQIFNGGSGGM